LKIENIRRDIFWEVVRNIKLGIPFNKTNCGSDGLYTFSPSNNLQGEVEAIEQLLKMESSAQRLTNLTREDLKMASEIYLYLNTCPHVLKTWFLFYEELFLRESMDMIVLTLNRLMKGASNYFFRVVAKKLFEKYEDIKLKLNVKEHAPRMDEHLKTQGIFWLSRSTNLL